MANETIVLPRVTFRKNDKTSGEIIVRYDNAYASLDEYEKKLWITIPNDTDRTWNTIFNKFNAIYNWVADDPDTNKLYVIYEFGAQLIYERLSYKGYYVLELIEYNKNVGFEIRLGRKDYGVQDKDFEPDSETIDTRDDD